MLSSNIIVSLSLSLLVSAKQLDQDSKRWTKPSNPTLFPSASVITGVTLPIETERPLTFSTDLVGKYVGPNSFEPNESAADPTSNPKYSTEDASMSASDSTASSSAVASSEMVSETEVSSSASPTSSSTSSSAAPTPTLPPQGSDLSPSALLSWTLTPSVFYNSITQFCKLATAGWGWNRDVTLITQGVAQSDWSKAGLAGPSAWNNGSAIRAVYPANSLTPGKKPLGGMSFYAEPLDLSVANNVSFGYSVFFPADFDFVLGGKLPGLYGGKKGCSGGYDALNCFSTRMMWRTNGMGEMYLYAPRGTQSTSLCSTPPLTYCNVKDGMSIGRGSFTFARGAWTHIRQDIWLNTPGVADGGFNIWVNGKLAMSNSEVLYRMTKAQVAAGGAVKAVPVQILTDSIPSRGLQQGSFAAINGMTASPFAVASACAPSESINYVYANGATKVVVTKTRKDWVYKTRTYTRTQTKTDFSYATSRATVTLPVTLQIPVATTTVTKYYDFRGVVGKWFEKRAKTTTRYRTKVYTKTVSAFATRRVTVGATQTYHQTVTIPTTVATRSVTSTIYVNVINKSPAATPDSSSDVASGSSSAVPTTTSSSQITSKPTTSVKTTSVKSSSKSSSTTKSSSSIKSSTRMSSSSSSVASTTTSAAAPAESVGNDLSNNPTRPFGFSGIMAMTFYGGSSSKWSPTKDEHCYFNNWELSING